MYMKERFIYFQFKLEAISKDGLYTFNSHLTLLKKRIVYYIRIDRKKMIEYFQFRLESI